MNIYVGNLNYKVSEEEIKKKFETFGEVLSVKIITDKESGRSRGFGFVEMNDSEMAMNAVKGLNNQEFLGRNLIVKKAISNTNDSKKGGFQKRNYKD